MRISERQLRSIIREELIRTQRGREAALEEVSWKNLLVAAGLGAAALAGFKGASSKEPESSVVSKEDPGVVSKRVAQLDKAERDVAARKEKEAGDLNKVLHAKTDEYSKDDLEKVLKALETEKEKSGPYGDDSFYKAIKRIHDVGDKVTNLPDVKPEDRPTKLFNAWLFKMPSVKAKVNKILGR